MKESKSEGYCFNCSFCLRPEEIDRSYNMHLYGLGICAHPSLWFRKDYMPAVTRGCSCEKYEPISGELKELYENTHLAY